MDTMLDLALPEPANLWSTPGPGRPHLDGRMPHADVADLFQAAAKCKTPDDVRVLLKRVPHVAAGFGGLVREFRASVPAGQRKLGSRAADPHRATPADRGWVPVADAFADGAVPAECDGGGDFLHGVANWTLENWLEQGMSGYDGRASVIIGMLGRQEQLGTLQRLVEAGVNLRRFQSQGCQVGGGLHLLADAAEQYLWLNQLLLLDGARLPWSELAQMSRSGFVDQGTLTWKRAVWRRATRSLRGDSRLCAHWKR